MRKILLFTLVLCIIGNAFSQNKYATKDLRKAIYKNRHELVDKIDFPLIPFKPSNYFSPKKAFTSIPIGTSGNVYMCLVDMVKWLSYNPELNTISFVHRLGGPWGGTSGNLRVKVSNDFFSTKDSVGYTQAAPGLCRYPSNIIYNPTGNTDPTKAFSLICGPSTTTAASGGWINSYFGSQKLDGSNLDFQTIGIAADTFKFVTNGLSGGNGKFHALTGVSMSADESTTLYLEMYNGIFNTINNNFDWSSTVIHTTFKRKTYAGPSYATFCGHENSIFEDNGLNGYFYVIGRDSFDNPGDVTMPIVWKTTDGGLTFAQEVYQHFATNPTLQEYIYPTRKSLNDFPNDPTQWVFRPNMSCGSVVDEGNSPGTLDKCGNLHIAALVEGLWSADPDSLDFGYLNHPAFLFDLIRTDTGWNAIFIDTLNTGFVESANSGFGTGTDAQGWGHWIRMSKNADGSKVFVTWTDTDPTIDTTNIMPEVHSWGLDLDQAKMTESTLFETGGGNIFYMMAADKVAQVGSLFKIPITYIDIYESGPNPLQPQKHYYLDGVEFDQSAFSIDVNNIGPCIVGINPVTSNSLTVSQTYPNPANNSTKFNVTLNETSNIDIIITNILGQVIYQTSKANAASGTHTFNLETKNWNNGIYFYTVSTGKNKITKKMIVE